MAALLAACIAAPIAIAAEPERIIVTNARLVGRDAANQDLPRTASRRRCASVKRSRLRPSCCLGTRFSSRR
jgi:hypothetical protein